MQKVVELSVSRECGTPWRPQYSMKKKVVNVGAPLSCTAFYNFLQQQEQRKKFIVPIRYNSQNVH